MIAATSKTKFKLSKSTQVDRLQLISLAKALLPGPSGIHGPQPLRSVQHSKAASFASHALQPDRSPEMPSPFKIRCAVPRSVPTRWRRSVPKLRAESAFGRNNAGGKRSRRERIHRISAATFQRREKGAGETRRRGARRDGGRAAAAGGEERRRPSERGRERLRPRSGGV